MTIAQEIVEIFEDFLEKRGVTLPNPERAEDPDACIIYGSDYTELEDNVAEMLTKWMAEDVASTVEHFLWKAVTEE